MNILKKLQFVQYKLHHRLSTGLYTGLQNIEIFTVKLSWSKLSRLLQHIAFSCFLLNFFEGNRSSSILDEKFHLLFLISLPLRM